jgi:hypothetical protein
MSSAPAVQARFPLNLPLGEKNCPAVWLQRREWAGTLAPAYFPISGLTLEIYFRTAGKYRLSKTAGQMGEESKRPVHSLEDVNHKMKLGNMALILNSSLRCQLTETGS